MAASYPQRRPDRTNPARSPLCAVKRDDRSSSLIGEDER